MSDKHIIMSAQASAPYRIGIKKKSDPTEDPRLKDSGYDKCMQCGRCTAGCPAAYVFDDYSPRDIMRRLAIGDREKAMTDLAWRCGQCYSCRSRCPRNNSAGLAILTLREEAVKKKLAPESVMSARRIIMDNLYRKGETFLPSNMTPHMLDQMGPKTKRRHLDNKDKRVRIGYLSDDSRAVPLPVDALEEIREILRLTGYKEGKKDE